MDEKEGRIQRVDTWVTRARMMSKYHAMQQLFAFMMYIRIYRNGGQHETTSQGCTRAPPRAS